MLIHLSSKKLFSVLVLAVFMFVGLGVNTTFAKCPYDILALCKVGNKWVNCCDHYGYTINGEETSDSSNKKLKNKSFKSNKVKPKPNKVFVAKPVKGQSDFDFTQETSPNGGASIYQMNGLKGVVPMKLTSKMVNGNEVSVMKIASQKVNEKMKWNAKLDCTGGTTIKHFSISTANGPTSVLNPANYSVVSMTKQVNVKPWSLNHVEEQCRDALTKANGDYKEEATIALQPNVTELVRFNASCAYPGTSNVKQYSGKVKPKTTVKCVLTNPPYVPET
ncbi:MAG: hypothetical protein DHS20C13_11090 [Thermodesulfobacteriota bacterium]|nr:MAG: hypothetical protein DHS20C13_11090 [Thermodesulfobacteriota bacterium]